MLEIVSKEPVYQLSQYLNKNFAEFQNSDIFCISLRKDFVTNFTCSVSFGVNSTCKAQLITSKVWNDDLRHQKIRWIYVSFAVYSNFPTAWTFVIFFYVECLDLSYRNALYAKLFWLFVIWKSIYRLSLFPNF